MSVSVVIPTLNAGPWLKGLLDRLMGQTVAAEILVIDSGSTDATLGIVRACADRVRLLEIPRERFDHGGTRDVALRQCQGDLVCFFTQDALPTDERCLENLLAPFAAPDVAAVFGRQIAWPDAPAYERLTRAFNYPCEARVCREADIPRYGVKAYFFSNACAAYRRSAYLAVGGFDAPIISNEDMMMAAKLLHGGYAVAYAPAAAAYHSHRYSLGKEYRRYVQIGMVMEQYRDRLPGARTEAEGRRYLRFVLRGLAREGRYVEICRFLAHGAARFLGNRAGRRNARRRRT